MYVLILSHSLPLSGNHEQLDNETLPLISPSLDSASLGGNDQRYNDPSLSHFPSNNNIRSETSIDAILATDLLSPTLSKIQAVAGEMQPGSTKPWICNVDHCFRDYSSESRLIRHQRENHGVGRKPFGGV